MKLTCRVCINGLQGGENSSVPCYIFTVTSAIAFTPDLALSMFNNQARNYFNKTDRTESLVRSYMW